MRRSNRTTRQAPLIAALLIAVAAGWALLSGPAARTRSGSSRNPEQAAGGSSLPAREVLPTTAVGPSKSDSHRPTALDASAAGRLTVYSSRFAGTPGYYPPDDPESLSVLTGKRDAPPVDLELSGGAASLRDLGQELLAALNARDEQALAALRVTKHEFRVICWPEFPESRPVTHITLDDAWMMAAAKSQAGSTRTMGLDGGRDLELLRVETDPPFAYRNFTRYGGTVLVARDLVTHEEIRLTFAPSVIERHGRFKVLIYRDR
ncbi:MAG TPA: hypothetical protein VF363_01780 [Candidatus Eisenbacteria bacterium]